MREDLRARTQSDTGPQAGTVFQFLMRVLDIFLCHFGRLVTEHHPPHLRPCHLSFLYHARHRFAQLWYALAWT